MLFDIIPAWVDLKLQKNNNVIFFAALWPLFGRYTVSEAAIWPLFGSNTVFEAAIWRPRDEKRFPASCI